MDRAAGYDLDVEVLTKVMGRGWQEPTDLYFSTVGKDYALAAKGALFSRDDAAAMRVVDEMVRRGWNPTLDRMPGSGVWAVAFHRDAGDTYLSADHADRRVAICLAALKAVAAATDSGKDTSASNADAHSMTAPEGPR